MLPCKEGMCEGTRSVFPSPGPGPFSVSQSWFQCTFSTPSVVGCTSLSTVGCAYRYIPKFPRGDSKPKKRLRENRAIIHSKDINNTHGIAFVFLESLWGILGLHEHTPLTSTCSIFGHRAFACRRIRLAAVYK